MDEKENKKDRFLIYNILMGLLSALTLTGLSLLVIAVIYLNGEMKDATAQNLVTACAILSVFLSSASRGRSIRKGGLLLGSLVGALYSLCLYFTGFLAFGFPGFTGGLLATLALSVLSGAIGGIVGVNLKGKRG